MSRTVFITGVSSGIGHGLATEYLRTGDVVYGVSRRRPEDLCSNDNFHFVSLDVTDQAKIIDVLPKFFESMSQLDIVVLNAGLLGTIGDMKDTSIAQLRELMDVNVWACKFVLDVLFKNLDIRNVVTISSGAAINGNRGWNGYSVSKAALNMLTSLYAQENEKTHFAAVAPGLVDTSMQDYLCGHEEDSRFPSLDVLKSKRGSSEMPTPQEAAVKLIKLFDSIEQHVESGGFVDIRHLPEVE